MRRIIGMVVMAGMVSALVSGCAGRSTPLIGAGAVRAPALGDEAVGGADGVGRDVVGRDVAGFGTGAIDAAVFDVFRASSFASGDGHRLVTLTAGGDCANRMGAQTMRFLSIDERTRPDGAIERTTRLMRHAQEDNPIIMRVEYEGAGGGWSMVQDGIIEEMRALRTHREVFVPHSEDGIGAEGALFDGLAPGGGIMRLLGTTNHERGSTLWFVADEPGGADGLLMNPALSEAAARWQTAGVIEGDEARGMATGTARLRSWIAGESNETDLPGGLVVMTELRIELGSAVLEREVVRVYAERDGVVMMRFERSAERTRVMGFGGGMRCEFGVVGVDVVGR